MGPAIDDVNGEVEDEGEDFVGEEEERVIEDVTETGAKGRVGKEFR